MGEKDTEIGMKISLQPLFYKKILLLLKFLNSKLSFQCRYLLCIVFLYFSELVAIGASPKIFLKQALSYCTY